MQPNLLEQLTGVDLADPAHAAALGGAFAAVIIIGQAAFKLHRAAVARRQRAPRRPVRPDMVATIIGAALVLALSIEGMWQFFTGIGMPILGRIAFAAVFEICLIAVALRARHIRLLRQARRDKLLERRDRAAEEVDQLDAQINAIRLRGLNDFFVWVFAAIIGTLAALEAPTDHEQVARFIVPFIAAGMWELALGADVEDQRVSAVARHWVDRLKDAAAAVGRACVQVAIHFGWVPPTSANATAQFREKLMTRLVATCHQIHTTAGELKPKVLAEQRKLILDLQARGQWTNETMAELAQRLDALYRAVELTAPAAVRPATKAIPTPKAIVPAEAPAPIVVPPQRRRRTSASKLDLNAIAAEYQRLFVELGRRPSVRQLGAAGTPEDGGEPRWSKSSAHQWMQSADLAALEADLEGVSA